MTESNFAGEAALRKLVDMTLAEFASGSYEYWSMESIDVAQVECMTEAWAHGYAADGWDGPLVSDYDAVFGRLKRDAGSGDSDSCDRMREVYYSGLTRARELVHEAMRQRSDRDRAEEAAALRDEAMEASV